MVCGGDKKMERKKLNFTICFRISPVLDLYLFLFLSCVHPQLNVFGVTKLCGIVHALPSEWISVPFSIGTGSKKAMMIWN